MIKQCKGKDLDKVPVSRLGKDAYWLVSVKYDGNYIQIHKKGNEVKFFTSGNKEFYWRDIANYLVINNIGRDFILEGEYIANTKGKLGDRTKAAKLTTYRTNFNKGIVMDLPGDEKVMIFDLIDTNLKFKKRLNKLRDLNLPYNLQLVKHQLATFPNLDKLSKEARLEGYEGIYAKTINHMYLPGKRVNNAIKLKLRPTADLLCIDVEPGEGKYEGMIGSLVLKDSKGRIVKVGSGLDDSDRMKEPNYFIGKVIEIEYEQILDTYIQPAFVTIRDDKTEKEIN